VLLNVFLGLNNIVNIQLAFLDSVFKWAEGNSDIKYEHIRW